MLLCDRNNQAVTAGCTSSYRVQRIDEMREEVKEGISPVMIPSYDNGYKRLTAVTSQAALVPITRSQIALLPGWIGAAEKVGMCHMLANRKEIQWVDEDDGTV